MSVDLKPLRSQDDLAQPEIEARHSIVGGELVMAAAPLPQPWTVERGTFGQLDLRLRRSP